MQRDVGGQAGGSGRRRCHHSRRWRLRRATRQKVSQIEGVTPSSASRALDWYAMAAKPSGTRPAAVEGSVDRQPPGRDRKVPRLMAPPKSETVVSCFLPIALLIALVRGQAEGEPRTWPDAASRPPYSGRPARSGERQDGSSPHRLEGVSSRDIAPARHARRSGGEPGNPGQLSGGVRAGPGESSAAARRCGVHANLR